MVKLFFFAEIAIIFSRKFHIFALFINRICMKLSESDLKTIAVKGITTEQLEEQLACFAKGFPYLDVTASVSEARGVRKLTGQQQADFIRRWDDYAASDKTILKFVPASGAASRMFKDLFAFLSADYDTPATDFEKKFFGEIRHFAFFDALSAKCRERYGKDAVGLIAERRYKDIAAALLDEAGLCYGLLPKGLLIFHAYPDYVRTAIEEHFAEAALYAANRAGDARLHLTVSPEHLPLFERLVKEKIPFYEQFYGVKYSVSFSVQQSCTDTIAADADGQPFRDDDGSLLFRPGGHGSLIQNLNHIDADVVFIKNIDNVVPDRLKAATIAWKKTIAGVLVDAQEKIFRYLALIDSGEYTRAEVEEMIYFLQDDLCIKNPEMKYLEDAELILYLKRKLMRPLRVCGMVRNDGEPGGGPFFAVSPDGAVALQIVESSQIDMNNPAKKALFEQNAYFNPVDLVCAWKKPDGTRYNLPDFVDKNTGFISRKSKNGRELQALEWPGLWNGAMSDWNTIFVDVAPETFNPVKTVNDLLRKQHGGN